MPIEWSPEELKTLTKIRADGGISVGVIVQSPFASSCFDHSENLCPAPGIAVELMREICKLMTIKCNLIRVNHTLYGDNLVFEWRGMVREIMDGKFNTSLPVFNPTEERMKVIDFSTAVYDESNVLITRLPSPTQIKFTSFFAFSWHVWALIILTMMVLGVLTAVFEDRRLIHGNPIRLVKESLGHSLDMFALFADQEPQRKYISAAAFVIFGTWGLSVIIIVGYYSGHILASMLSSKIILPYAGLASLSHCISAGHCELVTETISNSYFDRIYNSMISGNIELRTALSTISPPNILDKGDNLSAHLVNDDRSIFRVYYTSTARYTFMSQQLGTCTLCHAQGFSINYLTINVTSRDPVSFPFRRNSPLRLMFDRIILHIREIGMAERLYQKYVGRFSDSQELCLKRQDTRARPIPLQAFLGVLIVLGVGVVLGSMLFTAEKVNFLLRYRLNHLVLNAYGYPVIKNDLKYGTKYA